MLRHLLLFASPLVLLIACTRVELPQIASDHPANAAAPDGAMLQPSPVLMAYDPIAPTETKTTHPGETMDMQAMHEAQKARDESAVVQKTKALPGQYFCTMHPEVISDKPGWCPKCGMVLIQKQGDDKDAGPSGALK